MLIFSDRSVTLFGNLILFLQFSSSAKCFQYALSCLLKLSRREPRIFNIWELRATFKPYFLYSSVDRRCLYWLNMINTLLGGGILSLIDFLLGLVKTEAKAECFLFMPFCILFSMLVCIKTLRNRVTLLLLIPHD